MSNWIHVCPSNEIDEEDLIRWDYNDHTYAIYNTTKGFFATDGLCTHEEQGLEDGLIIDCVIECPLHGGRFDICTGEALSAPVIDDLQTYPVKVEDGQVYIQIG